MATQDNLPQQSSFYEMVERKVSCCLGWTATYNPLPQPPKCWDYLCSPCAYYTTYILHKGWDCKQKQARDWALQITPPCI